MISNLLSNIDYYLRYEQLVLTQLKGFPYRYLTLIILFNINYLFQIMVSDIPNSNNTGLQRNWDKHKNTRFYLIWGCWIQIWNPFLLITSSFLEMHSVHFVHIRYIKAYINSGLILIRYVFSTGDTVIYIHTLTRAHAHAHAYLT